MKLVAVTSCPTGIAHSQMAAESLEETANRLDHEIQVEIQGAMGAENELSRDTIIDANAALIAADTSVSQDRFEQTDVPVVKGTVKDAINDPESLFNVPVRLPTEMRVILRERLNRTPHLGRNPRKITPTAIPKPGAVTTHWMRTRSVATHEKDFSHA